jgi:hypothetical protein
MQKSIGERQSVCDVSASKRERDEFDSIVLAFGSGGAFRASIWPLSTPTAARAPRHSTESASSSDAQTQINARFHSHLFPPAHKMAIRTPLSAFLAFHSN